MLRQKFLTVNHLGLRVKIKEKILPKSSLDIFKFFVLVSSLFFLYVFYIELIAASKYSFVQNPEGIENLFSLFSSSIKIGTATFAIYIVKLTLRRINETENNNKLINFYLHRNEFINYFKSSQACKKFCNEYGFKNESFSMEVYNEFYYKSHKDFLPQLNKQAYKNLYNFYKEFNRINSKLKNKKAGSNQSSPLLQLDNASYKELEKIFISCTPPKTFFNLSFLSNNFERYFDSYKQDNYKKISLDNIVLAVELFFIHCLYSSLLEFEGKSFEDYSYVPIPFFSPFSTYDQFDKSLEE